MILLLHVSSPEHPRHSTRSILSFLLQSGPADQAQEWASLTSSQRTTIKSQYAAAGISLLVSLFGSTESPTSSGFDPVDTANTMAAWVKQYDLDGVDVDYEVRYYSFFVEFV